MGLTYPLITISTHAQTTKSVKSAKEDEKLQDRSRKTMLEVLKKIWKSDGFKGLYSGMESATIGIGLTNFIYYYFYELTKKIMIKRTGKTRLSTYQSMIIGMIAGCITVIGTNPVWVANTRLTVMHKEHRNANTLQIIFTILKEKNGLKQLFNGVLPLLVLVINPIIQYSFFEQSKNWLVSSKRSITPLKAFFLGAIGKLLATGSTYPYITLKLRMHLHKEDDKRTMVQLIKEIYQTEGISGFYNGMSVKLTQSILTALFLFYFKEELVNINFKLYKRLQKTSV